MGQKVNPHGLRVGVIKDWDSKWYAEADFADNLIEDYEIRTYLKKKLYSTGVSKIEIERSSDRVRVNVYTAKPGLVIGKGRNKICFLYEPGSLEAAKRVRQCYDMLQKHIEPALPCFRQTGQDLLDRRAFYRRCRKRQTILLLIGSFFAGVFCHNSSDPDATVMLIAAVVVGFCETLTLLSLYGTILLEAENEKKITREFKETDYIRAKDARFGKVYTAVVVVCLLLFNAWVIFFS